MKQELLIESLMDTYLSRKPVFVFEHITNDYQTYFIEVYTANSLEDKDYISRNKKLIKNFLDRGYDAAGLGKFVGCYNYDSVKRNTAMLKVAKSKETGDIIAMTIYSGKWGGLKCVGGTAIVTDDKNLRTLGVEALKQITREDVKLWGNFVWTECSDAIQHLWEKFGGIKIPSAYLPLFMDEYTLESIDTLEDDPYTYYRTVARGTSDERRFKKVIFGFPNREVLEKYINDRNITLKELCMEYGVDPNEVLNEEFQYRNAPKRLWPQLRLLKHYHRKFLDGMMEVTPEEQKVLNNALLDVYNEFDDKWENNSKIDGLWKLIVDIAFSLNRSIVLRIYEFGETLELEREVFPTYHLMPTTL